MTRLMDVTDLNSYLQLIQEVMAGTLRRNTFTPIELDFLLDIQASRMRKATKEDILRRYLKAVQQELATDGAIPLRFSRFTEEGFKDPAETTSADVPISVSSATSA